MSLENSGCQIAFLPMFVFKLKYAIQFYKTIYLIACGDSVSLV